MTHRSLCTRPWRRIPNAIAVALLTLAGCSIDEILDVQDPDVVRPESITGPASLPVLLAGAQSDFQVGFSGGAGGTATEGQVNIAGLFTDEFIQTESFPTRFEVEIRNITRENTTMSAIFLDLARARASAERAAKAYVDLDSANALGRATALNLAGYSYILFAENYCSGVPFSTLNEDLTIAYGSPQTTQQMLEIAVAKFDTALTVIGTSTAAAATTQTNLARIGRGRALLNLNRPADAATAVATVPIGFQYLIQHSENSARQNNGVWNFSTSQGRWGVSEREGANGLPFRSAADVRVPNRVRAAGGGRGFDAGPMQEQLKYPERRSNIVLADGVESELIKAEAALRAGNGAQMITILNGIRANAAVRQNRELQQRVPANQTLDQLLPPLTDPGSQTAREDLLFRERAFWLYLSSHRLGDLRRLVRQYSRPAASVFPSGTYTAGPATAPRTGTYGTDVNFPIPIEEGNNPNVTGGAGPLRGCINRDA